MATTMMWSPYHKPVQLRRITMMMLNDDAMTMELMKEIKTNDELRMLDIAELTDTMGIADSVDVHLVSQNDWIEEMQRTDSN